MLTIRDQRPTLHWVSKCNAKEKIIPHYLKTLTKTSPKRVVQIGPDRQPVEDIYEMHTNPSKELFVIGVTGTNGKTTVTYLLAEVLREAGFNPYVLGTLNSGNINLSTPERPDIMRRMKTHVAQGGTHFILEVTSEGIAQGRVQDIDFNIKVLTNITRDHLDYHKTYENYQQTKLRFMAQGNGLKIFPETFEKENIAFPTKLLGDFNLLNLKAAMSVLKSLGISVHLIQNVLSKCVPPRGRLESVDQGQPFLVLIDYAHTPDGLENILKTGKKIARQKQGKLLVLFGCGGNRDRGKRSQMGAIASQRADFAVITDDNPRLEESDAIITDILKGKPQSFNDYVVIPNRRQAIECIIKKAQKNDVVILAGKGHETYQITASGICDFDDREEARRVLARLFKKKQ